MIERPSDREVAHLATQLGLVLTDDRIAEIRMVMDEHFDAYDSVAHQPASAPFVAPYPRTPAYRPTFGDNPCNAWAYRTTVTGASSGSLTGFSIALKDTILLAGVPMLDGSRLLEDHVADMDATVVFRVLDAGGTILGKAQCEEFCVSGGSHTGSFGPVDNPRRPGFSAGGSSSGCAALVGAGAVDMAIGGDQGGSIRIPAAYCGINGMKPSWGLVPYTGAVCTETSLDHLGPMTRNVASNALLLSVIAGDDGLDVRQRGVIAGDYLSQLADGVGGLRIGVLTEGFDWPEVVPGVRDSAMAAVGRLQSAGAEAKPLSIPMHVEGRAFATPIEIEGVFSQMFQANGIGSLGQGPYSESLMAAWNKWPERSDRLNDIVTAGLLVGGFMKGRYGGRYYARAHALRRRLSDAYDAALRDCDVLVMPTLPMTASRLPPADAPLALSFRRASEMVCNTAQFNVTGHPALSTPCGMVDGLPVGLMIVARRFDEGTIYRVAQTLESGTRWECC